MTLRILSPSAAAANQDANPAKIPKRPVVEIRIAQPKTPRRPNNVVFVVLPEIAASNTTEKIEIFF